MSEEGRSRSEPVSLPEDKEDVRVRPRDDGRAAAGVVLPVRPATEHRLDFCWLLATTGADRTPAEASEQYEVLVPVQGCSKYRTEDATVSLEPGQVFISAGISPELAYSADCVIWSVLLPASVLRESCAQTGWFKLSECVRFNGNPCPRDEFEHLLTLLRLVATETAAGSRTAELFRHYAHVVANKVLSILQRNQPASHECAHTRLFERVERHIESRIKQDITVGQLAQFAGLSERSLYQLFRQHARMSPRNFIRHKKLEHVYATLMDPAVRVASVTAVALDYGFTHLGRFAELYKASFGTLPSESLKARQLAKESRGAQ